MQGPVPKPYMFAEELAAVTPWSVEAIRKKVQRGEFQLGVHYFQERRRSRLIFKWAAVVELIEAGRSEYGRGQGQAVKPQVIEVEEATQRLRQLLG